MRVLPEEESEPYADTAFKSGEGSAKKDDISQTGANDELLPLFVSSHKTWATDKVLRL